MVQLVNHLFYSSLRSYSLLGSLQTTPLLIRLLTPNRSHASISRKNSLSTLLHHLRFLLLIVLITRQGQAEPSTSSIRIAMPLHSTHEGFGTHPEQKYGPPSVANLERVASLPHTNGGQHIPANVEDVSKVAEPEHEFAIPTMFDSSDVDYLFEPLQFRVEIVRDADNPSQSLLSHNNTRIHGDDPLLMVHPDPDSSNFVNLDAPACKRLIRRAFSPQEVTSLIEAIFMSEDEVKMVRDLRGDDAQTFIDVIHEVCFVLSFPMYSLFTCHLSLPRLRTSTFCRSGSGSPGSPTAASGDVHRRLVSHLRSSGFASKITANSAMLQSVRGPAISRRVRRRVEG